MAFHSISAWLEGGELRFPRRLAACAAAKALLATPKFAASHGQLAEKSRQRGLIRLGCSPNCAIAASQQSDIAMQQGATTTGVAMPKFLFAGAAVLLTAAITVPAMAEGPRASSENHWPGMQTAEPAPQYSPQQYAAGPAARYVWEQGYDHGGKWRGHWTLVQ